MDIINKLKNEKIFALVAQLDRATDYGSNWSKKFPLRNIIYQSL